MNNLPKDSTRSELNETKYTKSLEFMEFEFSLNADAREIKETERVCNTDSFVPDLIKKANSKVHS